MVAHVIECYLYIAERLGATLPCHWGKNERRGAPSDNKPTTRRRAPALSFPISFDIRSPDDRIHDTL